jgi:hypothetical protein
MREEDLTGVGYERFVRFLFDRPVVPVTESGSGAPKPWYWSTETTFDPGDLVAHYTRLFTEPVTALAPYGDDQLEQGFWAVQGRRLNCSAGELIWDRRLPFDVRATLVRTMYELFKHFFAHHKLDTSVDMWWDSLAYDWHCNNRRRMNGGEDRLMQDVMFETLGKILDLPESHVQHAALHGLGHLHHPDTAAKVNDWMARTTNQNRELLEYAQAASRFEVM